jgi:hypothetical protein
MALSVKPNHASGYDSNRTALVRRACLEIATRLSDFKDDLCIIGGLVPSLLIDMATLPPDATAHVGTNDLDLGFSLAILSDEKYEEVANRLRKAGFRPDVNESGNPTSQRWRLPEGVLVDFLIEPSSALDKGGKLRNLESDLAAVVTPGLHLAFRDFEEVRLQDQTLTGGRAERTVRVCGPGAFVVLKSLAFQSRGENKDAYDLWYVLRNRGDTIDRFKDLAGDPMTQAALAVLASDFADADGVGCVRAAKFLDELGDDNLQADFAGLVRGLLAAIRLKRV